MTENAFTPLPHTPVPLLQKRGELNKIESNQIRRFFAEEGGPGRWGRFGIDD